MKLHINLDIFTTHGYQGLEFINNILMIYCLIKFDQENSSSSSSSVAESKIVMAFFPI